MPAVFGYPEHDRTPAQIEAARKKLEREQRANESWERWRKQRDQSITGGTK